MTVIAASTTAVRHEIRLVHSATSEALTPVAIGPVAWPTGWAARVVGGTVVVTSRTTTPGPEHLDVIVVDGEVAELLELPAVVDGQSANSVRVPLTAVAIDVPVDPRATVLTVELAKEGSAGLSTGKTVIACGSGGTPVVPLTETSVPGVYASDPTVWPPALNPADVRVGGTSARKVFIDFTRSSTRITAFDPT